MSNIKYISHTQMDDLWGMAISSCGHQAIAPGEEYPPKLHKQTYMFVPQTGRILSEYQLVYIIGGAEGWLQKAAAYMN